MFVEYVNGEGLRGGSLRMERGRLVVGRRAGFGQGRDG